VRFGSGSQCLFCWLGWGVNDYDALSGGEIEAVSKNSSRLAGIGISISLQMEQVNDCAETL